MNVLVEVTYCGLSPPPVAIRANGRRAFSRRNYHFGRKFNQFLIQDRIDVDVDGQDYDINHNIYRSKQHDRRRYNTFPFPYQAKTL